MLRVELSHSRSRDLPQWTTSSSSSSGSSSLESLAWQLELSSSESESSGSAPRVPMFDFSTPSSVCIMEQESGESVSALDDHRLMICAIHTSMGLTVMVRAESSQAISVSAAVSSC